jgi:hypothetical protein
VDVDAELICAAPLDRLRTVVADLATYPRWLEIVASAEPTAPAVDDAGPAWDVVLRASVGPLRRSKRLRMVRTVDDERAIRFERRELDGRSHSDWVLDATFRRDGARDGWGDGGGARRTVLRIRLHYGGSLWLPVLDRLLSDEIERSRPRLVALVA